MAAELTVAQAVRDNKTVLIYVDTSLSADKAEADQR